VGLGLVAGFSISGSWGASFAVIFAVTQRVWSSLADSNVSVIEALVGLAWVNGAAVVLVGLAAKSVAAMVSIAVSGL